MPSHTRAAARRQTLSHLMSGIAFHRIRLVLLWMAMTSPQSVEPNWKRNARQLVVDFCVFFIIFIIYISVLLFIVCCSITFFLEVAFLIMLFNCQCQYWSSPGPGQVSSQLTTNSLPFELLTQLISEYNDFKAHRRTANAIRAQPAADDVILFGFPNMIFFCGWAGYVCRSPGLAVDVRRGFSFFESIGVGWMRIFLVDGTCIYLFGFGAGNPPNGTRSSMSNWITIFCYEIKRYLKLNWVIG